MTSKGMAPSGPEDVAETVADDEVKKGDKEDIKAPPQTADQSSQVQTTDDQLLQEHLSTQNPTAALYESPPRDLKVELANTDSDGQMLYQDLGSPLF